MSHTHPAHQRATEAPIAHHLIIPDECANLRLDKALAHCFPDYSRAKLQQWIKTHCVCVDGAPAKAKQRVQPGQAVDITATLEQTTTWEAQPIDLDIIFEDEALLVINKPANLVVHPGAGNHDHTLVNALLHHAPQCAHLPRAGIIHRLDKDTTGLLVVPKSLAAHTHLVQQLQARTIKREYLALVRGQIIAGDSIDAPMGRHRHNRLKMAVIDTGKPAVTHYRVEKKWPHFTLLRVNLETGRTHQIRVHLAHIQHPIVGDMTYAGRNRLPGGLTPQLREILQQFQRQALHATVLAFTHPLSLQSVSFEAPLPTDFAALLDVL